MKEYRTADNAEDGYKEWFYSNERANQHNRHLQKTSAVILKVN